MKNYLLLTLLFAGLASCVNKPTEGPVNPEGTSKFEKMNVPASFDWKTFSNVSCNIKSDTHVSLVSLFTEESTEPLASFYVGKGIAPLKISIPNHVSSVNVKYDTEGGQSAGATVKVENGAIAYSVPADSKDYTEEAAKEADKEAVTKAVDSNVATIIYPSSAGGLGTLMFEDLWPSYGDFDMNDFVVKYQIGIINQFKVDAEKINVALTVAAVGGSQPYDLYLQLNGVNSADVKSISAVFNQNGNHVVYPSVTQINTSGKAVFKFNDILKNKNATPGVSFFNTSVGNEFERNQLVYVAYSIVFNKRISVEELTLDKFDFFIAKDDSKEIHMSGYAPTSNGASMYETLKTGSSLTANASDFYKSTSNIVWAFNVTSDIAHAYERVDFIEAYPQFKTWAESNGKDSKDWFKNPVVGKVNKKSVNPNKK